MDALEECTSKGNTKEECFAFFNAAKHKKQKKEKREKRSISRQQLLSRQFLVNKKEIEKLGQELKKPPIEPKKWGELTARIIELQNRNVTTQKEYLDVTTGIAQPTIQEYNDSLNNIKNSLSYFKNEKKHNTPSYEGEPSFYEDRIKELEQEVKNITEKKKEYDEYIDENYYTNRNNPFGLKLNEKILVAKEGIVPIPENTEYKERLKKQIEHINNSFNQLTKSLKESCSEVRIYNHSYEDPIFYEFDQPTCSGFYRTDRKSITIGLRSMWSPHELSWLEEITIHEASHALDYQQIPFGEREKIRELYNKNRDFLEKEKRYAAKNEREFFAECYTKLAIGDYKWFESLDKEVMSFFKFVEEKYDFLGKSKKEAKNEIKFSYSLPNGDHIFGKLRIPQDITEEKAEEMVRDGKAEYLQVYNKKEKDSYSQITPEQSKSFDKDGQCVANAMDSIGREKPHLSVKDKLDFGYKWCQERKKVRDFEKFDCSKFWGVANDFYDSLRETTFSYRIFDLIRNDAGAPNWFANQRGNPAFTSLDEDKNQELKELYQGWEWFEVQGSSSDAVRIAYHPQLHQTMVEYKQQSGQSEEPKYLYQSVTEAEFLQIYDPNEGALRQGASVGQWIDRTLKGHGKGFIYDVQAELKKDVPTTGGMGASLKPYEKLNTIMAPSLTLQRMRKGLMRQMSPEEHKGLMAEFGKLKGNLQLKKVEQPSIRKGGEGSPRSTGEQRGGIDRPERGEKPELKEIMEKRKKIVEEIAQERLGAEVQEKEKPKPLKEVQEIKQSTKETKEKIKEIVKNKEPSREEIEKISEGVEEQPEETPEEKRENEISKRVEETGLEREEAEKELIEEGVITKEKEPTPPKRPVKKRLTPEQRKARDKAKKKALKKKKFEKSVKKSVKSVLGAKEPSKKEEGGEPSSVEKKEPTSITPKVISKGEKKPFPKIEKKPKTEINPLGAGKKRTRGTITEAEKELRQEEQYGFGRFLPSEVKSSKKILTAEEKEKQKTESKKILTKEEKKKKPKETKKILTKDFVDNVIELGKRKMEVYKELIKDG